MSADVSRPSVSYWVRRQRELDAAATDDGSAWTDFVESEAWSAVEDDVQGKRAS
jgi:hypothetical protein